MSQPLKLKMLGKLDSRGDEYFYTRPDLPCMVDLSKVVIFVHPFDDGDGSFGAELVFKEYTGRKHSSRPKEGKPRREAA